MGGISRAAAWLGLARVPQKHVAPVNAGSARVRAAKQPTAPQPVSLAADTRAETPAIVAEPIPVEPKLPSAAASPSSYPAEKADAGSRKAHKIKGKSGISIRSHLGARAAYTGFQAPKSKAARVAVVPVLNTTVSAGRMTVGADEILPPNGKVTNAAITASYRLSKQLDISVGKYLRAYELPSGYSMITTTHTGRPMTDPTVIAVGANYHTSKETIIFGAYEIQGGMKLAANAHVNLSPRLGITASAPNVVNPGQQLTVGIGYNVNNGTTLNFSNYHATPIPNRTVNVTSFAISSHLGGGSRSPLLNLSDAWVRTDARLPVQNVVRDVATGTNVFSGSIAAPFLLGSPGKGVVATPSVAFTDTSGSSRKVVSANIAFSIPVGALGKGGVISPSIGITETTGKGGKMTPTAGMTFKF